MSCLTTLEADYETAKKRLQAAQQEKLEAAAEFLSARAALSQGLEWLWPDACPCGDTASDGKNTASRSDTAIALEHF